MKRLPGQFIDTVVRHLPLEISRFTYFILDCGANIACKVVETTLHRSLLVQGGLEIHIKVIVEMDAFIIKLININYLIIVSTIFSKIVLNSLNLVPFCSLILHVLLCMNVFVLNGLLFRSKGSCS